MSEAKEIGLFCGTFNPIHNGHLILAQCASEQFSLHKVYFVTSPRPPHRQDSLLPAEYRFKMVSLAVQDNENFLASNVELEREGPSYTIDTIQYFKQEFSVNLIMGSDNIVHLPTWHKFDEIGKSCRLLVAPRRIGSKSGQSEGNLFTIEELMVLSKVKYAQIDCPLIDISSSAIRSRIKQGKNIRYLVPEIVCGLIAKEKYFV